MGVETHDEVTRFSVFQVRRRGHMTPVITEPPVERQVDPDREVGLKLGRLVDKDRNGWEIGHEVVVFRDAGRDVALTWPQDDLEVRGHRLYHVKDCGGGAL